MEAAVGAQHASPDGLDIDAYLRRIDYRGPLSPSLAALEGLHLAHATHIPFENLDVILGRPIRLGLDDIQAKLVRGGRGGYCFEQNLLFSAVLERLGFRLTRLAARVRFRADRPLPRTHMLLLVDVDGGRWLADVGFGSEGLFQPVAFGPETPSGQFDWTYRVARHGELWRLQSLHGGAWIDLYAFSLDPQEHIDYVMANHFTSTHPDSRFVQTLTAQAISPTTRTSLRNRELSITSGGATVTRTLSGEAEIRAVLAETFGLHVPAEARFTIPL